MTNVNAQQEPEPVFKVAKNTILLLVEVFVNNVTLVLTKALIPPAREDMFVAEKNVLTSTTLPAALPEMWTWKAAVGTAAGLTDYPNNDKEKRNED